MLIIKGLILISVISITSSNAVTIDIGTVSCAVERVEVFDGAGNDFVSNNDGCITICNATLMGSYASRNRGVELSTGEHLLLLDDDVKVLEFPRVLPTHELFVPCIEVVGQARSPLEYWYKYNAFDQDKFVLKERMAPTITWLFRRAAVELPLFDESMFSGGDVKAARRFDEIVLRKDFRVATGLRSAGAIVRKFSRQAVGHHVLLRQKAKYTWGARVLCYIAKNMLIGNGLNNFPKVSEGRLQYVVGCFLAGWVKAYYAAKYSFSATGKLYVQGEAVNRSEVKASG